jgi:hypothetical protein
MNLRTPRLTISSAESSLKSREVQSIFNSNPDFIVDSEGAQDRCAYTIEEVNRWPLLMGQARENQPGAEAWRRRTIDRNCGFGDATSSR